MVHKSFVSLIVDKLSVLSKEPVLKYTDYALFMFVPCKIIITTLLKRDHIMCSHCYHVNISM